jgi:Ubiquitin 3 binding protein But2 C-terminal domain
MGRAKQIIITIILAFLLAPLVAAGTNTHLQFPMDVIAIDYEQPDTPLGSSQAVDLSFDRTRWLSRANIFRFTDIPADATNCQLSFSIPYGGLSETASSGTTVAMGSFTSQIDGAAVNPTTTTWNNAPGPFGATPDMGTLMQGTAEDFSVNLPLNPQSLTLHPTAHAFSSAFTCPGVGGVAAFRMSVDLMYSLPPSGTNLDFTGVWGKMSWGQGFGPAALAPGYQNTGFYIIYQTPCTGTSCLFS